MLYDTYTCQETAHMLNAAGFPIVLCTDESPISADWRVRDYDAEDVNREFEEDSDLNVGLVLGPRSKLMEIVVRLGGGNKSHHDFYDLMQGEFPETPTFESRFDYHYIFGWDDRFDSIGLGEFRYKSVLVRVGAGNQGAFALLPPSSADGMVRTWHLTMEDYLGSIMRIPHYVADKLIAAHMDGCC